MTPLPRAAAFAASLTCFAAAASAPASAQTESPFGS